MEDAITSLVIGETGIMEISQVERNEGFEERSQKIRNEAGVVIEGSLVVVSLGVGLLFRFRSGEVMFPR